MKSELIFKPVNGVFVAVNYISPITIDDALSFLHLLIDDDCQFCRIVKNGTLYVYRHYNNSKITLNIYEQDP